MLLKHCRASSAIVIGIALLSVCAWWGRCCGEEAGCPSLQWRPGVCLDPGHGGPDAEQWNCNNGDSAGGCGWNGLTEVWVNHEIVPLTQSALGDSGFYTICTKSTITEYLPIPNRCAIANANRWVDIFFSVHHEGLSIVSDTRVFYVDTSTPNPETGKWAYKVALGAATMIDEQVQFGYGMQVKPDTDSGPKKLGVLRGTRMPGALSEASSLKREGEELKMAYHEEHRQAEADGIRDGLVMYEDCTTPQLFSCWRRTEPIRYEFSWNPVEGADGYLLYVRGYAPEDSCPPGDSTVCYDTHAATTYTLLHNQIPQYPAIAVRAYVTGGFYAPDSLYVGGFSRPCIAYWNFNLCFGTSIDRMITDFTAAGGNHQVILTWHAVSFDDGVKFEIWRSTNGGQSYEDSLDSVDYEPGIDDYTFVDATTGYRMAYCYKIRDTEGNAWWGPACGSPASGVANPPAPSPSPILAVDRLGDGHVHLCLEVGSEYADYYRIYRQGGGPDTNVVLQGEQCLEWTELENDTTYYFKARARNYSGWTDYSSDVGAIPMARPAELYGMPGDQCVYVWWDACTSASGYRVYYATSEWGPWQNSTDAGDTTATTVSGLENDTQYYLYVVGYDVFSSETDPSYLISVTPEYLAGAEDPPLAPPRSGLGRSCPNPFHSSVAVPYTLARPYTKVRLIVYDAGGREVRRLVEQAQPAGCYEVAWDGRDRRGRFVPSGMYFYRLEAGELRQTNKMLLVR